MLLRSNGRGRRANLSHTRRRSVRLQEMRARIHTGKVVRSHVAAPKAKSKKRNDSVLADTSFKVKCPALLNRRNRNALGDVLKPKGEDGGFKNLNITYAVRPESTWEALKPYQNFIRGGEKFPVGSIVYINRKSRAPRAPPPGSSAEKILKYDRENLWVAKVLEIRAKGKEHIYLRVFWLYWPDELPNGRQPYHGKKEFVMSNHMDIVDALTVADLADVTPWNEMEDGRDLGQRYFRQFLDVMKLGGAKGSELSALRQYCTCHQFYNPDTTMYQCGEEGCRIWNHEECLKDSILQKIRVQGPKKSLRRANLTQEVLSAKISKADNGKPKATITNNTGHGVRSWEMDVKCLRCMAVI